MRLIVDIPSEDVDKLRECIKNGIPLNKYLRGIKTEICNLPKLRYSSGERVYLDEVLDIIDKRIGEE